MNYENIIVCFIDILGFKNIIDETIDKDGNDSSEKIKSLNETLLKIRGNSGTFA